MNTLLGLVSKAEPEDWSLRPRIREDRTGHSVWEQGLVSYRLKTQRTDLRDGLSGLVTKVLR